jgi:tetratricopeptide (TPR) repeat protein
VTGRRLFPFLLVVLLAATVLEVRRAAGWWRAGRILAEVERVTVATASQGRLPMPVVERGLRRLDEAERLHPSHVGPPTYRGNLYLLSHRPKAAVRAYETALAIEPRAEVYANLGRAHLELGDRDVAQSLFQTAIFLDRHRQSQNLAPLFDRLWTGVPPPPRPPPGVSP